MLREQRRHGLQRWSLAVLCTLAAWISVSAPARAYQLELSDSGASVRWYVPDVLLRLDPELEEFFSDIPMARLMREAAATWGGFSGAPRLQIADSAAPGPGLDDAQNVNGIYLARDWAFEADALATTVATFESRTGRLVDADVYVNANFQFAWLSEDGKDRAHYDLLAVMTHELGHVLGLGDAMTVPEATMSPHFKRGDTHQRDLSDDDEQGLAEVYADTSSEAAARNGGCGGASVLRARAEPVVERSQIFAAAAFVLVLWLWSRKRRTRYTVVLGGILLFGALPAPRAKRAASMSELRVAGEQADRDQRIAAFTRGAQHLIEGRALNRRSYRHKGLIWTHLTVQGSAGAVELALPGGELDGLTQVVSGRALPEEGDQLVIAQRAHGPHAWAQLRDGLAFGGSLGEGPALRIR